MLVVAHRGLHASAPENSLAAVQAAVTAGCERIEVDVRSTADGHLVLMHDAGLGRTTTVDAVLAGLRAYELGEVRLADGSPLPSLHEVLEVTRDRAVLCVDVKEPALGPDVIALVDAVGASAEIWSSHREVVARAADRHHFAAWISHGVMPAGGPADLADEAVQLGARALSFYPADVMPEVSEACHRAGLGLMSGTPNDRGTWEALRRQQARAVVTDRPLDCAAWLSEGTVDDRGDRLS
ncbi:MAG: glycerophosphodiester phosphodiesterase [Dehalococcoidia bacterium]